MATHEVSPTEVRTAARFAEWSRIVAREVAAGHVTALEGAAMLASFTKATPEPCECSEEYGPCEQHCTVLVIREGASLRTADELAMILITDLVELGEAELSPYGADVVARAAANMVRHGGWIEDDGWLSEALSDVAWQIENSASDVWVTHDDGYTIVRPSADCPLVQS